MTQNKSKGLARKSRETVVGSDDQSPIVRANVNRVVTTAPTFQSLYANDVQLQTTPWDVRLTFGEFVVESGAVNVKQTGEVRMSPQLAKRVALLLVSQLKKYEERFGGIPQPGDED